MKANKDKECLEAFRWRIRLCGRETQNCRNSHVELTRFFISLQLVERKRKKGHDGERGRFLLP